MGLELSAPYRPVLVGTTLAVALPEATDAVRQALEEFGTLFEYARRHPRAERLQGRGPLYAIPAKGSVSERWWVVRHYRRGGAVARWLGDRYLRVSAQRPLRELRASEELRRRGIETPRIVAAAIYPSGLFYRADVATERVQHAVDLAQALFGSLAAKGGPQEGGLAAEVWSGERGMGAPEGEGRPGGLVRATAAGEPDAAGRLLACRAAGRLVRDLGERGVIHGDLNAKNILLQWTERPLRAYLLDLDRCRFVDGPSPRGLQRMWRRLRRSLRKWEARTGRALTLGEWEALEQEVRSGHFRGPGVVNEGTGR